MKARLDYARLNPAAYQAMLALQSHVNHAVADQALLELVKLRASQINDCAFCIDMHARKARAAGESEQRLFALSAWRETGWFSDRERAALAWAEALTRLDRGHVPDDVFAQARAHFSEPELVDLSLAVVAINGWNRLCVAFRTQPGALV